MVAAAIVGGAVIGGVASNRAANTQAQAANNATDIQRQMYEQNRQDLQPWRQAGQSALGYITPGIAPGGEFNRNFTMQDFQQDPGYDFRMQEGLKAIERSRAARGGLFSGATGKSLERYGQDMASQEYANAFNRYRLQNSDRFNRLASVAGIGQTATDQLVQQGSQFGQQAGNNMMSAANARASGYVGGANAFGNAAGQYMNYTQNQSFLNALRNPYMNQNFGQMDPYTGNAGGSLPAWGSYEPQ